MSEATKMQQSICSKEMRGRGRVCEQVATTSSKYGGQVKICCNPSLHSRPFRRSHHRLCPPPPEYAAVHSLFIINIALSSSLSLLEFDCCVIPSPPPFHPQCTNLLPHRPHVDFLLCAVALALLILVIIAAITVALPSLFSLPQSPLCELTPSIPPHGYVPWPLVPRAPPSYRRR